MYAYINSNVRYFLFSLLLPFCPLIADNQSEAVILQSDFKFQIKSLEKATYHVHYTIQINKASASEYAFIRIYEDKYLKPTAFKGILKDIHGNEIRRIKKKEIHIEDRFPGYMLYSDQKLWWINAALNTFPYIIDYEYELDINSILYWPHWFPQEDVPVLHSTYTLQIPWETHFNKYEINLNTEANVKLENFQKIYQWELDTIPAKNDDSYLPDDAEIQTGLLFSPNDFIIDKTKGNMESWQGYCNFYKKLINNLDVLPAQAIHELDSIYTANAFKDKKDIIDFVYRYVQKNSRYVAIELGIGGIQPYSASFVYENKYGDCKDLSIFTIALLKHFNINAYPFLIHTRGSRPVYQDFPMDQFNHVIVCALAESDSVWLECTSDLLPAGELTGSTEGQYGLLINEHCNSMTRTPVSDWNDNRLCISLKCKLSLDGSLKTNGLYRGYGNYANWIRSQLYHEKNTEQKTWIADLIGCYSPQIALSFYELKHIDHDVYKPASIYFDASLLNYSKTMAKRLFLNPNIIHRKSPDSLPREVERTFDLEFREMRTIQDSIIIELPEKLYIEAFPDTGIIATDFAFFKTSYLIQNSQLTYSRIYQLKNRRIPVAQYNDYVEFMKKVVQRDRQQFVFTFQ